MTKIVICLIAVFGCVLIYACTPSANNSNGIATNVASTTNSLSTANSAPPSNTAGGDELAAGRDLYNKSCSKCHKETGEGGPTVVDGRKLKPANLTDDRRKRMSDQKIIDTMVQGIEDDGMPSFKDKLSDAEMREIVHYIRVGLQNQPDTGTTGVNTNAGNSKTAPSNAAASKSPSSNSSPK